MNLYLKVLMLLSAVFIVSFFLMGKTEDKATATVKSGSYSPSGVGVNYRNSAAEGNLRVMDNISLKFTNPLY